MEAQRFSGKNSRFESEISSWSQSVLSFWFEDTRPRKWFRQSNQFDWLVTQRFGELSVEAQRGGLFNWEKDSSSCLALVLILDQFSRQIWRDSVLAYEGDARALRLSQWALKQGWIASEPERARRQFWLMPMLHSESVAVVTKAIPLLERFADSDTADLARRNRITLNRYGYYPWRDVVRRCWLMSTLEGLN